jgi:hypothetical protein
MDIEEVARITTQNAKTLFKLWILQIPYY